MRLPGLCAFLVVATGCAPRSDGLTLQGRRCDGAAERALMQRWGAPIAHEDFQRRATRVAARLGCHSLGGGPCRFVLLDGPEPNAFSLPGPTIYVTLGLLERLPSDAALAAVVAHEVAHIEAGDSARAPALTAGESLELEVRADRRATQLLHAANLPVAALGDVLRMLSEYQPPGWTAARLQALGAIAQMPADPG